MAKQVINYGTEANDGTGDALRTAMIKIVANFDELYDGQFSGKWADLTNLPTTLVGSFGIVDGANNQVLTTNGNGTLTFKTPAASYGNAEVDAHLNLSSAANNQILSWDGNDFDWVNAGSGGGIALTDLSVGAEGTAAGDGSIAYNNTNGVFTYTPPVIPADVGDLTDSGGLLGGSLQSRTTKSVTASSLVNNGTSDSTIVGFKGYNLYSIQTTHAAWVRLYISASARSADASRGQTSDPAPDAGVIAEVITTGAETVKLAPAIAGYTDDASTNIIAAITNLSGATQNITVTLSLLQLEA